MLLGNKCDMTARRAVPKECGERIAVGHGIRFFETSARANINIDEAFHAMAKVILDKVSSVIITGFSSIKMKKSDQYQNN